MAGKKVGITLALGGEKEYTQGFTNAVKATKMLQAETKSLAQEFDGSANSMKALQAKQENLMRLQDSFKQKLEAANTGLGNARKQYEQQSKAVETLREKLDTAQKALNRMKENGEEGSDACREQEKAIEKLNHVLTKQTTSMLNAQGRVTDWNKKVIQSEADIRKNSKALEENGKYLDEARNAANGCATSIDEFGKAVRQANDEVSDLSEGAGTAEKTFTGLGDKIASAVATKGVSVAVDALGSLKDKAAEAAKYVIDVGSSFEAGMSQVAAISGASAEELEQLEEKAQQLGASTKFSATEAADAMTNMSLAGWTVEQTLDGIDGVMQLAAASGMDLADASQIVTDNVSSFGLAASDASRLADMMAYAQANSSTTAAELGEAYKNCAANMNAGGQDIETTTSLLEALANNGLRGSEAGTTLTAVMRDMTSKMKDGKIAIGDTNVEVMDSNGNFRNMTDILKDVEDATGGMGDAQKQAALMATFTSDSIKGLNMMLSTGSGQIAGFETSLRNCSGAAGDMADTMQDNLRGSLDELGSAAEGLGIAIYDHVKGPVKGAVDLATAAVSGLTDIISPAKDEMENFSDSVAAANEQLEMSIQNRDDTIAAAETEAGQMEALGERLITLNGIENKSAAQKAEIAQIVDRLKDSVPELAAAYDEETGSIKLSSQEIRNYVEAQKEAAIQQATLAANNDLINSLVEAQSKYDEVSKKIEEIKGQNDIYDTQIAAVEELGRKYEDGVLSEKEYQDGLMGIALQYEDLLKTGGISISTLEADLQRLKAANSETLGGLTDEQEKYGKTIDEGTAKVKENTESARKLTAALTDSNEKVEEGSAALAKNGDAAEGAVKSLDEAAKSVLYMGDSFDAAAAVTESAADTVADSSGTMADAAESGADAAKTAMDSMLETYNSTVESIKSDLQSKINPFEKFDTEKDKGEDATVEQMTENLNSQIEAFENYSKNLEAVKDHVGKEISPEFMQYIEDMGMDGANMLEHILQTFADDEPEKVKELSDKWGQAMDQTENIARAGAANKVALEAATGELASSDADFSELRESIDKGVASAAEAWQNLPDKTRAALESTIATAQECGIKIPDGLAEGIASGETTPEQAIAQMQGALKGSFDALAQMAAENGIKVPEELSAGISQGGQEAVDAYSQLISLLAGKMPELQQVFRDGASGSGTKEAVQAEVNNAAEAVSGSTDSFQSAGEQLGSAVASGITQGIQNNRSEIVQAVSDALKADDVKAGSGFSGIGEGVAEAIASGIREKSDLVSQAATETATAGAGAAGRAVAAFQSAGNLFAQGMAGGISAQAALAKQQAVAAGMAAASAVSACRGSFVSAGGNMAAGLAAGINANRSSAITAAANMAAQALAAAKARLDIHSPSKAFRNQVGKQIPAGMAFGIRDSANLATAAASQMSQKVLDNATVWLTAYRKKKSVAAEDEKWYWQQVLKHVEKGTEAYNEATAKMIAGGVSATKTTGSGKKKKTVKKDAETYYSEIYTAAEKYMTQQEALNDVSVNDQIAYWTAIQKQLKAGMTAWYNAESKIKNLKSKIGTVSNMSTLLSTYQTYFDMSEKAEEQYWDAVRKQYKEGTDERLQADEKYLAAKEKLTEKLKDIEDDYQDKVEDVNKKLKDDIADLTQKYKDELADRAKSIKDAYGLFDEFTSESADGKTLLFNIKAQAAGYEDWSQQLDELEGKNVLSKDLMDELKEQGPEISAAIHALNSLTEDELKEYNEAYMKKMEMSQKQAEEDTQDLKAEIDEQTKQLNGQAEKDKADLKAQRDASIESVNKNISSELAGLAKSAKTIADDQTTKLVAAITGDTRKAELTGDGGDQPVTPAQSSSGGQAAAAQPAAAAKPETQTAAKEDAVLKIINSGTKKTSMSAAERKKHTSLYNYIFDHYKRKSTAGMYKKLAKELGVSVGKNVSSSEKKKILSALKKKGYKDGGKINDDYAWMDEYLAAKGPEMVVRKSDNAILTRVKPGDEVLDASTAANLAKIGKYSLEDLRQMVREQSAATVMQNLRIPSGMEKLNHMAEQPAQPSGSAGTERLLSQMIGLLQEYLPNTEHIGQKTQIVLDDGTLVGRMAERMGSALAARQRRSR